MYTCYDVCIIGISWTIFIFWLLKICSLWVSSWGTDLILFHPVICLKAAKSLGTLSAHQMVSSSVVELLTSFLGKLRTQVPSAFPAVRSAPEQWFTSSWLFLTLQLPTVTALCVLVAYVLHSACILTVFCALFWVYGGNQDRHYLFFFSVLS